MNAESVEQLIALFQYVVHNTQENQLKLAALESTINHQQELNGQSQAWCGNLRFVPSARADRQQTEAAIELLRQALLQDSERCEIRCRPDTCACKPRSGNIRRK